MDLSLYTDGGSRNNPGQAAIAFIIYDKEKQIYAFHTPIGIATNNVAEYTALIHGLKYLQEFSKKTTIHSLSIFSDSLLMVSQVQGKYKIKDQVLLSFVLQARELIQSFSFPTTLHHVLREKNSRTDALVKQSLGF